MREFCTFRIAVESMSSQGFRRKPDSIDLLSGDVSTGAIAQVLPTKGRNLAASIGKKPRAVHF